MIFGSLIMKDNRYLIHEAYVGKTDTLLQMEAQIGIIRASIKKGTDINKSKEVQKLNRLFEKQFGMEIFALHVIQSNIINAYTYPINTRYDVAFKQNISKMVEGSKTEGYKFKEGNGLAIICCIYWGLLTNPDYTDAEIMAVLLHELGHNFADAIYNKIKIANINEAKQYYALNILRAILSFGLHGTSDLIKNTNKYNKIKEKNKISNPIRGIIASLTGIKKDFSYFVSSVLSRLGGGFSLKLLKKQVDEKEQKEYIKSQNIGRQNEVIADLFAGIYGYGPDQASALFKMTENISSAEKFVDKIPLIGKIKNEQYNDVIKDLCNFDVHPHVIQRCYEEIRLLEEELKKTDLDPKLAATIKEQIKQMKDLLNDVTKVVDESQKSEVSKKQFYSFLLNQEPEAVTKEIEDEIFEALDKALEKK